MFSTYPMELPLHWGSAIFSSVSAIMALYLVPLSGRVRAWLLLSLAFVLFSIERLSELMSHADLLLDAHAQGVASDVLLFTASVFLFGGVFYIRNIFHVHNGERSKLMQRLDELQRFNHATIGRELRMKELYEENQTLKAQIKEWKK